MDFAYTDEQQELIDLARKILTDRSAPDRLKKIERGGGPRFDPELWAELAKAGIVGVGIPEEFGGNGFGFLEVAGVIEQVGRTTAAVPYLETVVLGSLPLVAFGTAEQKRALLPEVARGELILTAALVEPEGELLRPLVRAEPVGADWQLSGVKVCVPFAELAQRILVPARTPDGDVGLFLVDPASAGVTLEPMQTTSGQPEALLELANVTVAAGDILGSLGEGRVILDWMSERLAAAQAALAFGVCSEALRLTAEYTTNRKQFGQPIASFQAAGQRAANAYIDNEAIRLTALHAAWRIAAGLPAAAQAAVAKLWAADAGHRVVHAAQHLHGGVGVDRDYPLHRYFLYARQIELTNGNASAQLRRLGKMIADGSMGDNAS